MASFDFHDYSKDSCQLCGELSSHGFDRWWHSFTGFSLVTGKPRNFFIEFFLCNPDSGSQKPVHSNPSSGICPSYLMVKVGSWGEGGAQLHKFYGWKRIDVDFGIPFSISAGEMFLSEDGIKGCIDISAEDAKFKKELMTDSGFMSWSLVIEKKLSFGDSSGWHAEGMQTSYSGEVIWNGEHYSVRPKDCNGYADKSWGRDFPKPWIWLSSCKLRNSSDGKCLKSSAFITGGEKFVSALKLGEACYVFGNNSFRLFNRTECKCRESQKMVIWHIVHRNMFSKIEIDVSCRKQDMLLTRYESPDGLRTRRRFWTGGNGRGSIRYVKWGRVLTDLKIDNVNCGFCADSNNERSSKN